MSPFIPSFLPQSWQTPYGITDSDIKGIGIPQPLNFILQGLKLSKGGMFHPGKATLPSEGGTLYGITDANVEQPTMQKPISFAMKGLPTSQVFHPLPVPPEIPGPTYKIQGTTKDETGSAMAGFTVYLFNVTSGTPVLEQTVISDGAGLYSFTVDSTQTYWVVDYKEGTPDKTGATVNTLTGIFS